MTARSAMLPATSLFHYTVAYTQNWARDNQRLRQSIERQTPIPCHVIVRTTPLLAVSWMAVSNANMNGNTHGTDRLVLNERSHSDVRW